MAKKQELFGFARMTPAAYLDDLQQLRIPEVEQIEKAQDRRQEAYSRGNLDDSD